MIIKRQTTVIFDPVAEHAESQAFVKDNPSFRLMGESTMSRVFAKTETWMCNNKTAWTYCDTCYTAQNCNLEDNDEPCMNCGEEE